MKEFMLVLLISSGASHASVGGCEQWAPNLYKEVKKEIEKIPGLTAEEVREVTNVKDMKFWDDKWATRISTSKVKQYERAKKGDKACTSEFQLAVSKEGVKTKAICVMNSLIFNDGDYFFTLENCEEHTKDKEIAAMLNEVGRIPRD